MSDASSLYRCRVLAPKKPRNIPLEAEQLLYQFTAGSSNPPKGQSDCFFATNLWDSTSSTPPISTLAPWREAPNTQITEIPRTTSTAKWNTSLSSIQSYSSSSTSTVPHEAPSTPPIATVNTNSLAPHQSLPSTTPTPTSTPINSSARLPSNETPRQAPRDQLRKTVTVSNANQMTPVNIIQYQPQRPGSSRHKKRSPRPTITPQSIPSRLIDPRPTGERGTSSESGSARLKRSSATITPQRTRGRESSPEYQSSRASSDSPAPLTKDSPPRRSSRARREPITYNVRALVGLELEPAEAADRRNGNGDNNGASSPMPSNTPEIPIESQTPQSIGSGALRDRPNIENLLRSRQQGQFISNSYYKYACNDRLSELNPWRSWKGASGGITSMAWSPDGTRFSAGATTHGGDYNRGNNLVLGDLSRNSLTELPDHWVQCENPHSTQDSRLFATVSSTQWVGEQLYSGSFDKTVKMWDIGHGASCVQTLTHDAQVEVMAASKYSPRLLATGTKSGFRLWDLGPFVSYQNLPISRSGQKNVELSPTNLIWGNTPVTKNLVVGGMVQRTDDVEDIHVARYGHLAMWKLEESSVTTTTIKLSPDSQNIFDIKWHPSMPIFATASSMRDHKSYDPRSQSLVNLYAYVPSATKAIHTFSFGCPAVDINETTFSPFGSYHVTASCTDGITYVWDIRNQREILHELRHGQPDYPINHEIRREYADVGVSAALWGTSIDQFYTGASDGFIKQWDIRRATEDALVSNVAEFNDGITRAVFSPDNAHLLVGDTAGGVHVLSSGPCADPEPRLFNFEYAPVQDEACDNQAEQSPELTGVEVARHLLDTRQLTMNPLYGPVQGPNYSGPFARWPRGIDADAPAESVAQAPLLEVHQLRQFQGPSVKDRNGLDEHSRQELQRVFNLAHACNGPKNARSKAPLPALSQPAAPQRTAGLSAGPQESLQKRKRERSHTYISSGDEVTRAPAPKRAKRAKQLTPSKNKDKPAAEPIVANVIDLTLSDDDEDGPVTPSRVEPPPGPSPTKLKVEASGEVPQSIPDDVPNDVPNDTPAGKLVETPDEALEEDYWWPDNQHVDANIPRGTDG